MPIRKNGKLPADSYSQSYALEYGQSSLHIHKDALNPGERVLLIDDVLATGGTLAAATSLIRKCGAVVVNVAVLMEIDGLNGRENFSVDAAEAPLTVLL